jgi:hypothetical protein
VKYIAKSAAKNINSLASQTIVPTATRLGRFIFWGGRTAVVIGRLFPIREGNEIFIGQGGAHFW